MTQKETYPSAEHYAFASL